MNGCTACGGVGVIGGRQSCPTCLGTTVAPSGPVCACSHPESFHVKGECIALLGEGWAFCPCERFTEVAE